MTLTCEATGDYIKFFEWSANATNISQGEGYNITSDTGHERATSTLIIRQLQLSHGSLHYRCTAGNRMSPDIKRSNTATIRG